MQKAPTRSPLIYKRQTALLAKMREAGVSASDIATLWGVAPTTARHRLSGMIGLSLNDLVAASAAVTRRHNEIRSAQSKPLTQTTESETANAQRTESENHQATD
jgi:hypothetical protein